MNIFYITIVALFSNRLFYLVPRHCLPNLFFIVDIGLVLVICGLFWVFISAGSISIVKNKISLMILIYLLFIAFQVALAGIYYHQSLIDGFIGARHQAYYLTFFVFLLLLNDSSEITKMLNVLCLLSLVAILLCLINYFGPDIFHHSGGEIMRSGIKKAQMPGKTIIVFSALWAFCRLQEDLKNKFALTAFIVLLFGIFFNQGRASIVAVSIVILIYLILRKKIGQLFITFFIMLLVIAVLYQYNIKENIIINAYRSTFETVFGGYEAWEGRAEQITTDINEIKKHPWIGSGNVTLRLIPGIQSGVKQKKTIAGIARKTDLGYLHWVKAYGLFGTIWLGYLVYLLFSTGLRLIKKVTGIHKTMVVFCICYLVYVMISFVTLNHFMQYYRIPFICLISALLVRIEYNNEQQLSREESSFNRSS